MEHRKGNKTALFDALLDKKYHLYYNQTVLSEYLFAVLGHYGQKSPLALKMAGKIAETFQNEDFSLLYDVLIFLENCNESVVATAIGYMKKYNMLSNDAIILAHCKSAKINNLASYDSDFKVPCQEEGITLIDSIETFQRVFSVE